MTKKYIYLLSALIISLIILGVIFLKPKNNQVTNKLACQNKEHKISLTLQSGEKGTLAITDNHCDLSASRQTSELSFKVLADGAIEDSIYQSKLYIWSRDNNLTTTEQINNITSKFNKNKLCQAEKNNYPQHDGLITYALKMTSNIKGDCLLFGPASDFTSEIFMENNNLLILQRQDGSDGIEPFDLASLRFVRE